MKKFLASLLAATTIYTAVAQTGVPGQISTSFVQVRDYGTGSPISRPCMLWLPASYNALDEKHYPLLVFLHGIGEGGHPDGTNVDALRAQGPFYFLHNGSWDGSAYPGAMDDPTPVSSPCIRPFIVFAIQAAPGSFQDLNELEYALQELSVRYKIATDKIALTGLSAGGEVTVTYGLDINRSVKPRHIVPMSVPFTNNTPHLATLAQGGMKAWAFTHDVDGVDPAFGVNFTLTTTTLVNNFNAAVLGSAKLTQVIGQHCCWNTFYDPSFREPDNDNSGQYVSIYEWLQKNFSYYPGTPPLFCGETVCNRKIFAGFLTNAQINKIGACNNPCITRIYTDDGTIAVGKKIFTSGCIPGQIHEDAYLLEGNNAHYGLSSPLGYKGAPAEKHLVISASGTVTTYENCISIAGYIGTAQSDPAIACSQTCSSPIYSNASVISVGVKVYQDAAGTTPYPGGWMKYGFTTISGGNAQNWIHIGGDGIIIANESCSGGGKPKPDEIVSEQVQASTIRIFPNPASKQLNIQLPPTNEKLQLQLFNMNGILIHESHTAGQSHSIRTEKFAAGVYLLTIKNSSGKHLGSKKIIIQ